MLMKVLIMRLYSYYASLLVLLTHTAFASDQDITASSSSSNKTSATISKTTKVHGQKLLTVTYHAHAWMEETGTSKKFKEHYYLNQLQDALEGYKTEHLNNVTNLLVESGALAKCGTGNEIKYLLELFKNMSADRFEIVSAWMIESGIIDKCNDGDHIYFLIDIIRSYPAEKKDSVARFLKNDQIWSKCLGYADAHDFLALFRDFPASQLELVLQYTQANGSWEGSTTAAKLATLLKTMLESPPKNMHDLVARYKAQQTRKPSTHKIERDSDLSLDDLAELIDLQQDYHDKKGISNNTAINHPFAEVIRRIYKKANISKIYVPALRQLFPQQLEIPCILFAPEKTNGTLIVHTHGGPKVEMTVDSLHAEIAYYLSYGDTVLCPNYFGTYSDDEETKRNLPRGAVQDVIAAAAYCKGNIDGIKSVFLRGGSYGSCVNAHILRYIKLGRMENLFSGVHLMGGLKYPAAHEIPDNIPIFIAHGAKDEICHVENAARFALQLLYAGHKNVQTFIAPHGDHHMMLPTVHKLTAQEADQAREDTRQYLAASTAFTMQVSRTGKATITEPKQQIQALEALLMGLTGNAIAEKRSELLQLTADFNQPLTFISHNPTPVVEFKGPTMAHLRLVLGDDFVNDPANNLKRFFRENFNPVAWPDRAKKIPGIGAQIAGDERFIGQLVPMIYAEEHHLASRPNSIVMYHAAPGHGMRLYMFINIWLALLRGESVDKILTMRLFDQLTSSHPLIQGFLVAMRQQWQDTDRSKTLFNYIKGFQERALAASPYLTAGRHNSAVCSLLWFYNPHLLSTPNTVPYKKVIAQFLKVLGIHSEALTTRFKELFDLDEVESTTNDTQQTMLQQVFIPVEDIDNCAYMCQMWGVEYAGTPDELTMPSNLVKFAQDPKAYETRLVDLDNAFTNPEGLEYWGRRNFDPKFKYSDFLQMRSILYPGQHRTIHSYIRNPERADAFMGQILPDILWAFGDFLTMGKSIPTCLIAGCQDFPDHLRERLSLPTDKHWSDYVLARFLKSLSTTFLLDHSMFSGVQKYAPQEMLIATESIPAEQLIQMRGTAIAKACSKRNSTSHFNLDKYIRGCQSLDLGMWHHWGKGKRHGSPDYNDVMSTSIYLEDRTYIDILAEAGDATLDDTEYATFMNYVYIFRKRNSGVHQCLHTGPYQQLKGLCRLVERYKIPASTPLTKEANKSGATFEEIAGRTIGYALAKVSTEAYLAEKNGSDFFSHKFYGYQKFDPANQDDGSESE
jgi:alpha/beta superfamily hydrolase